MCAPRRQNSELCRKKSRSLSCKHSCRATFHQRYLNFSSPGSHTQPNIQSVSQTKPLVKHPTSHTESPVRQSASRTPPPDKHRVRRFSSQPVQQLHKTNRARRFPSHPVNQSANQLQIPKLNLPQRYPVGWSATQSQENTQTQSIIQPV